MFSCLHCVPDYLNSSFGFLYIWLLSFLIAQVACLMVQTIFLDVYVCLGVQTICLAVQTVFPGVQTVCLGVLLAVQIKVSTHTFCLDVQTFCQTVYQWWEVSKKIGIDNVSILWQSINSIDTQISFQKSPSQTSQLQFSHLFRLLYFKFFRFLRHLSRFPVVSILDFFLQFRSLFQRPYQVSTPK